MNTQHESSRHSKLKFNIKKEYWNMYWKIIEKLKKKYFSNTTFWKNCQMQIFQKKYYNPNCLSIHPFWNTLKMKYTLRVDIHLCVQGKFDFKWRPMLIKKFQRLFFQDIWISCFWVTGMGLKPHQFFFCVKLLKKCKHYALPKFWPFHFSRVWHQLHFLIYFHQKKYGEV